MEGKKNIAPCVSSALEHAKVFADAVESYFNVKVEFMENHRRVSIGEFP